LAHPRCQSHYESSAYLGLDNTSSPPMEIIHVNFVRKHARPSPRRSVVPRWVPLLVIKLSILDLLSSASELIGPRSRRTCRPTCETDALPTATLLPPALNAGCPRTRFSAHLNMLFWMFLNYQRQALIGKSCGTEMMMEGVSYNTPFIRSRWEIG
jgi:hypothetical protein